MKREKSNQMKPSQGLFLPFFSRQRKRKCVAVQWQTGPNKTNKKQQIT